MATGLPYWDDDPESWHTLVLGTQPMPGVWDIEDGSAKRVFDIKKSPGREGAIVKDMGYENGALLLVGQIVGADQLAQLEAILESLKLTQKGKQRTPLAISHPKSLLLGITQVEVAEIEVLRIDNGIGTQNIRVLEYIPKPKTTGKKKPKDTPSLEQEVARTEEQKRIQRALDEFRARDAAKAWPEFQSKTPNYLPYTPP